MGHFVRHVGEEARHVAVSNDFSVPDPIAQVPKYHDPPFIVKSLGVT
jgi:hypothetical protein